MKVALLAVALMLFGCSTFDLKTVREMRPKYDDQLKGQYAPLARCTVEKLQNHERWFIRVLQFTVRIYPDIEKSEIQAYGHSNLAGSLYAFILEMTQKNKDSVQATLRGYKEADYALDVLKECSAESKWEPEDVH